MFGRPAALLGLGLGVALALVSVTAQASRVTGGGLPPKLQRLLLTRPSPSLDLLVDAPVQIDGARKDGRIGTSIASGDVNGDGHADLVGGTDGDTVFVAFGPFPPLLDLRTVGKTEPGFRILGHDLDPRVAVAGDVNGDHLDDILLLSGDWTTGYVVFGRTETTNVDLGALEAQGYAITLGASATVASRDILAAAGDVNADGHADMLVRPPAGQVVYVVFGKATTERQNVAHLGAGGYPITVPSGRDPGALAAAGDVDRDGLADIMIGAAGSPVGTVWVVFGKTNTSPESTASLGTHAGYAILGSSPTVGQAGTAVDAGDVNGDGVPDQLVADQYLGGTPAVVFGKGVPTTTVDTSALGSRGYLIEHEDTGRGSLPGQFVSSMAGGVDLNRDGRADQVLGYDLDNFNERSGAGAAYVVYGKASTTSITMGDAGTGYRLDGPGPAYLGSSVALAPAGADEAQVLVGAKANGANGRTLSGSVYAIASSQAPKARYPASHLRLVSEPPSGARASTRRTLRFTLERPSRLVARLERVIAGRRTNDSPPRCEIGTIATAKDRCEVHRTIATWHVTYRQRGPRTLSLKRDLLPGRYRLVVVVTDVAGHHFTPYRLRFNVHR